MDEHILVSVRARPLNQIEKRNNETVCWKIEGNTITSLTTSESNADENNGNNTPISTPTLRTSSPIPSKLTPRRASYGESPNNNNNNNSNNNIPFSSKTSDRVNSYTYDHIFSSEVSTATVYETVADKLVWSTMEGFNSTIFAYGQTNSGKTYTMKGVGKKSLGIIPLAIQDVWFFIRQTPNREFLLRVSYLEIYNEIINDLLAPESINLRIHEDPQKGVYIGGLKEEIVVSPEHILSLIATGEAHRHVGSTDYNDQSSRSHTIFRLVIESKEVVADPKTPSTPSTPSTPPSHYPHTPNHSTPSKINGSSTISSSTNSISSPANSLRSSSSVGSSPAKKDENHNNTSVPVRLSTLNLIDLAGSERASEAATQGTGYFNTPPKSSSSKEGGYINKSLLTLGNVIAKLSERVTLGNSNTNTHIPFRDSKLTRILQHSLSGNARIGIICTITLARCNYEETHSTLKFANRAKNIKSFAKVNEVLDEKALIKQYRQEIAQLRLKLEKANSNSRHLHLLQEIQAQKQEIQAQKQTLEQDKEVMEKRVTELEFQRQTLESKIQHLTKLILVSSSVNPTSSTSNAQTPHVSKTLSNGNNDDLIEENDGATVKKGNLSLLNKENQDLQNELNQIKSLLFQKESESKKSATVITQLSDQLKVAKTELEEKTTENFILQKEVEELKRAELWSAFVTKNEVEKTVTQKSSELQRIHVEKIKELEGKLIQQELDISMLTKENTHLTNQLQIQAHHITMMQFAKLDLENENKTFDDFL